MIITLFYFLFDTIKLYWIYFYRVVIKEIIIWSLCTKNDFYTDDSS